MASEESFIQIGAPPSTGNGFNQSPSTCNSRAPNKHGTTYVRVGRGIVPITRYDKSVQRGRSNARELATTSVYGVDEEMSPGGTPKPKWYKQPFKRGRYLSLQGILSGRSASSTNLSNIPATPWEAEPPVIDITPARAEQGEAGPSKLRKPHSRGQLLPRPVSPTPSLRHRNRASTPPPPRQVQGVYLQPPSTSAQDETDDEDGQLLLNLLGVKESPPVSPRAVERVQLHRLPISEPISEPTSEPELKPDRGQTPTPIRRLPPVPVLNIVPPHDSQDAFSYVFGPNHQSAFMEHRGTAAPPPYVARQSAILDRYMGPARERPVIPDDKSEVALPPVAPLTIRRRDRN